MTAIGYFETLRP